jgi:hypothetical protein
MELNEYKEELKTVGDDYISLEFIIPMAEKELENAKKKTPADAEAFKKN